MKSYAKLKLVTCSLPQAYGMAAEREGRETAWFRAEGKEAENCLLDSCSKLVWGHLWKVES